MGGEIISGLYTGVTLYKEIIPGEEISHTITVSLDRNETSVPVMVGIYEYGMGLDGTRMPQKTNVKMDPYSAARFLTIVPENGTLDMGKPLSFIVEGKVPEDVGSGGRYALVYITTPPQTGGQIAVGLGAIIPIRLTISGMNLFETGEITSLNVSKDGADAIFMNNGNHHFTASAEARLLNDAGNQVVSAIAPLMYTPLVPMASWQFKMPFENLTDLAPGSYTVEVSVIHENGTVLDSEEKTLEI